MISFPSLGELGRLGNQLFQIAATIGLARDHDDRCGFPQWPYQQHFPLEGCFYDCLPDGPHYVEPNYHYDPIPYAPNLALRGFFQSERYFAAHAAHVRRLLTPLAAAETEQLTRTASLQVRRGDYVYLQAKHPLVPMSFYEKAMDVLRAEGTRNFLVFSDDLDWCRSQAWPADVTVIPNLPVRDQFTMTMACEHHILANSTFSWWTAWLDRKPGKIVIAPAAWFGEDFRNEFSTRESTARGLGRFLRARDHICHISRSAGRLTFCPATSDKKVVAQRRAQGVSPHPEANAADVPGAFC